MTDPSQMRRGVACPGCGEPLREPRDGQTFTPSAIPTIEPSKVCETCAVGYWLGEDGLIAVATLDL
jgi:uncharacterized protein with PIN domain